MIEAWKTRGKIPVAIEHTATFVSLILDDSLNDDDSLRVRYAMAVIRSVNALTDSAQKGSVAASVESLARNLGIPSWIVDIRHEATHSPRLPPLHVLRLASQFMLEYFRNGYWTNQLHACVSQLHISGNLPTSDHQTSLLNDFITRRDRSTRGFNDLFESLADESTIIRWVVSSAKTLVKPVMVPSAAHWLTHVKTRSDPLITDLSEDVQLLLSSFQFLVISLIGKLSEEFTVNLIEGIIRDPCTLGIALLCSLRSFEGYTRYRALKVAAQSDDRKTVDILTPLMERKAEREGFIWAGLGNSVDWDSGKVRRSFEAGP